MPGRIIRQKEPELAKFATFLTVCLFIVNGLLIWLRDDVKRSFPTLPGQIGFHLVLSAAIILLVLVGNGLFIWFFRARDLDKRLTNLWTEWMSGVLAGSPPCQHFEEPLDRVAQLCLKMSRQRALAPALQAIVSSSQNQAVSLSTQLDEKRDRLAEYEKSALPNIALRLADHWRLKAVMPMAEPMSVDDPVYGRIYLDRELSTVLSHPILQRLARVKQLSFSYARFPSATHTRLSHSLGVAKNAEMALNGIIDLGVCYPRNGTVPKPLDAAIIADRAKIIQKAKLASLLHDIGHGPFGHALDNYTIANDTSAANSAPDKKYGVNYILEYLSPTLESVGFDPTIISNILGLDTSSLGGIDNLISEVIDSPLDADRMDYLIRDADMTGLRMGFTNTMALMDFMRPMEDDGALFLTFDEAAISYIEHFLYAREAMYANCYEDPGKMAAERIFSRLVALAISEKLVSTEDLLLLVDEEIISVLKLASGSAQCTNLTGELTSSLRYKVVHEIDPFNSEAAGVKHFAEQYSSGDDLRLIYVTLPDHWETKIAEKSIGPDRSHQIQVLVPPQKANLQRHSQVRILCRASDARYTDEKLFSKSKVMQEILKVLNPLRVQIRVACPIGLAPAEVDAIKREAMHQLGA